jgi:ABC-type transport system substrate-binding protein
LKNKILLISLAMVFILGLGLAGCTGAPEECTPPTGPNGTLNIELVSVGFGWLPWKVGGATDKNYASGTIYESLTLRGINGTVLPCLAWNWTMTPDGMNYTINIVPGVPFHDMNGSITDGSGNPYGNVTAEDVKYTLERIGCNGKAPGAGNNVNCYNTTTYPTGYPKGNSNIYGGLAGEFGANMSAAIEVVNSTQLIVHLAAADIKFMDTYTGPDMWGVVCKKYVDSNGDGNALTVGAGGSGQMGMVGTGPYILDSVVSGSSLTMKLINSWASHWRYGPLTSGLNSTQLFQYMKWAKVPALPTRVADLESGKAQYVEIDYTVSMSLTGNNTAQNTIQYIKATDLIRLGGLNQIDQGQTAGSSPRWDPTNPWSNTTDTGIAIPASNFLSLYYSNWTVGMLVRQALNYAVDKTALINTVYLGQGTQASVGISIAEWLSATNLTSYTYNPTKAEQLLDQAGYTANYTGPGIRFPVTLVDDGRYSNYANAELIKNMWGTVGISVTRAYMDYTTQLRPRWSQGCNVSPNLCHGYAWLHRTPQSAGDPAMAINMAFDPRAQLGDYTEATEESLRSNLLHEANPVTRNNNLVDFGRYENNIATQVFLVSTYTIVGVSGDLNVGGIVPRTSINEFDLNENPELIWRAWAPPCA